MPRSYPRRFVLISATIAAILGFGEVSLACCGLSLETIARIGRTYGVEEETIKGIEDQLAVASTTDLRMLIAVKSPACRAYQVCGAVPDEFFRLIVQNMVERRNAEIAAAKQAQNEAVQSRNFWLSLLGAVGGAAGVIGAVISVLTYRREGKQSPKVAT